MVGRSLDFGKKFGIAWDLLVEIRRILAAANERTKIPTGEWVPRTTLTIDVSSSLRSSGVAIMSLPRLLRARAAELINGIDQYNSIIEIVDPGQRENARLNDRLRELLREMISSGDQICAGLTEVLKDEL
jgi:hypothetical protein